MVTLQRKTAKAAEEPITGRITGAGHTDYKAPPTLHPMSLMMGIAENIYQDKMIQRLHTRLGQNRGAIYWIY
ncbi:unnamed protein product [Trichogramma brassicae]|uniref:Uncharacterized protein n=1 Tax=Trichogramma brassicae TaxID=86971 RepID=A0A6H5J4I7_9HYME|nr:unnamed protein product [Trichogramma brassicae]